MSPSWGLPALLGVVLWCLAQTGDAQCVDSSGGVIGGTVANTIETNASPRGVAVDGGRDRLYVAEEGSGQLRAFSLSGGNEVWSTGASGAWGVAADTSSGRVFVSKYGDRVVVGYDADGNQVMSLGDTSSKNYGEYGFFMGPAGLACTGGVLVVCDPDNHRFQTFSTADGSFLGAFGIQGFGDGAFGGNRNGPFGVAAYDAGGQLYFADPNLHRVTRWSSTGGFGDYAFASAFGALGREPGMLWSPFAVAVSQTTGDVFVSSTNTFRTEVFSGCGSSYRGTIGSLDSTGVAQCGSGVVGETLFGSAVPALEDTFQFSFSPVTVGVRFTVVTSGYLTAVRFVKPSGDVSQHTVKVWDDASQGNLYSETLQIDACPAGVWVRLAFTSPVAVTGSTSYVVSIDNLDQYTATDGGFVYANPSSGILTLSTDTAGASGDSNGGFPYTTSSTNYWVDAEFQANLPGNTPPPVGYVYGSAFNGDTLYVADSSNSAIKAFLINSDGTLPNPSPGPAPTGGSGTPAPTPLLAPTDGTATEQPTPVPGDGTPVPTSVPAPPASGGPASCGAFPSDGSETLYTADDAVPTTSLTDGQALVLGTRFTAGVDGSITAFRYFRAADETAGTHVGNLFLASTGELLASTGSFDDSGCTGGQWVSAAFSSPVQATAGVEYVVALDSVTHYVKTDGALSESYARGDLTALAGGAVFGTTAGAMPQDSYDTSNVASYWLDVEFTPSGRRRLLPRLNRRQSGGFRGRDS